MGQPELTLLGLIGKFWYLFKFLAHKLLASFGACHGQKSPRKGLKIPRFNPVNMV
jgi:hypothetical protein